MRQVTVTEFLSERGVKQRIDNCLALPRKVQSPEITIPVAADARAIQDTARTELVGIYWRDNRLRPSGVEAVLDLGLVGTAVDLFLRMTAIKLNKLGMGRFIELDAFVGYLQARKVLRRADHASLMDSILTVLDGFYSSNRSLDDEFLKTCLHLAQFETVLKKAGYEHQIATTIPPILLNELRNVVTQMDSTWLKGTHVLLSPEFSLSYQPGRHAFITGVGDIVVDDTLYEIKNTSTYDLRAAARQLGCYLVMDQLSSQPVGIKNAVAVFPRFNAKVKYSTNDLFVSSGRDELVRLLQWRCVRPLPPRPISLKNLARSHPHSNRQ